TDNDGFGDCCECIGFCTDAWRITVDSDGDGMPDGYENLTGNSPSIVNERFALLISAPTNKGENYPHYWNDLMLVYDTLYYVYNYKNIIVLYADGNFPNEDNSMHLEKIIDQSFGNPSFDDPFHEKINLRPATPDIIKSTIAEYSSLAEKDMIFIYYRVEGSISLCISGWNGSWVDVWEVADYFLPLSSTSARKIILCDGTSLEPLASKIYDAALSSTQNKCVITTTATNWKDEITTYPYETLLKLDGLSYTYVSTHMDIWFKTIELNMAHEWMYFWLHGENLYYIMGSLRHLTPPREYSLFLLPLDTDNNGITSLEEAIHYTKEISSACVQHRFWSDMGILGALNTIIQYSSFTGGVFL
ncbi:MAG: hypothetical protein ACP5LE_08105, partial [Thermoplasmata archaeon]